MRFASALIAAFALCIVTSPAVAESGAVIRADELKAMGVVNRRGSPFPLSRVCEILHGGKKRPPEAGG